MEKKEILDRILCSLVTGFIGIVLLIAPISATSSSNAPLDIFTRASTIVLYITFATLGLIELIGAVGIITGKIPISSRG
ncbi:MAG TPA: hypothetical protein ENH06_00460 [bacterium]|nr:hypothetical protein [bacterium]